MAASENICYSRGRLGEVYFKFEVSKVGLNTAIGANGVLLFLYRIVELSVNATNLGLAYQDTPE